MRSRSSRPSRYQPAICGKSSDGMGSPPSVMSRLALFGYAAPSEPLQGRSTSLGTGGTPIATAVPAYASISHGLSDARRHAGRLERDVDAIASGEIAHRGHRIHRGRVDHVGRAQCGGPPQLRGSDVDRDQAFRARDPRSLHRGQPDAAEADHRHGGTRPHLRGLDRGPDTGGHPAPEQACAIERDAVRQRDRLCRMDHGAGREGSAGQDPGERGAVPCSAEPGRLDPRVGAAPGYRRGCTTDRCRTGPPTTGPRDRRAARSPRPSPTCSTMPAPS